MPDAPTPEPGLLVVAGPHTHWFPCPDREHAEIRLAEFLDAHPHVRGWHGFVAVFGVKVAG